MTIRNMTIRMVTTTMKSSNSQSTNLSLTTLVDQVTFSKTSPLKDCELIRYDLQPGLDLMVWRSNFETPHQFHLHDDLGRIHFTCALQGEVSYSFAHLNNQCHYLTEGNNCINFTPDQKATAHYHGTFESVIISIAPDVFNQWGIELSAELRAEMNGQYCYRHRSSPAEIQAHAHSLRDAIKHLHQFPNIPKAHTPLWFQGNGMMLISLIIEQYQERPVPRLDNLNQKDHQRLLKAREKLLSDLTKAPTIAMLAQETGLSVLKIKRGFRQVFGNSVYGLFQQERMREAKRRLSTGNVQVVTVATDLGYSNASHFTTAFQKQFGVNPSALKRGA